MGNQRNDRNRQSPPAPGIGDPTANAAAITERARRAGCPRESLVVTKRNRRATGRFSVASLVLVELIHSRLLQLVVLLLLAMAGLLESDDITKIWGLLLNATIW
ncbi:MAG: hypothetical protein AAGB05_00590 [Pseudomonadota bacterium]